MSARQITLYESIASEIEKQIQSGIFQIGDKIPSVRRLSKIHDVGVNTILQAYILLERRGLIEARPKSGFFVCLPQVIEEVRSEPAIQKKPGVVQIPDLVSSVFEAASDGDFVQLGAACFSPELYPNESLARITRSVLRNSIEVNARYEFSPGNLNYRQQVAKRLARAGNRVSASDVIATNGAQEAIYLALRTLVKAGDTVLIESPNYFGVLQAIASLGLKVIEVPAHSRTGVDPDDVKQVLSRHKIGAALLMPNFNNPLGSAVPNQNKRALAKIFSHFGVPVIEDDVYGDLDFSGLRPKLMKSFDEEGIVLTCSAFSKTVSPGSRCGWVLPGKYFSEFRRLQLSSTLGTNRLQQVVLAEFLSTGAYERHLRRIRPLLEIQVQKLSHAVLRHFPDGTRITQPRGGFMLWVELPRTVDSVELYQQALSKRIGIAPGVIFSANGNYRNYIRLNCGRIWTQQIDMAVKTIGSLARKNSLVGRRRTEKCRN